MRLIRHIRRSYRWRSQRVPGLVACPVAYMYVNRKRFADPPDLSGTNTTNSASLRSCLSDRWSGGAALLNRSRRWMYWRPHVRHSMLSDWVEQTDSTVVIPQWWAAHVQINLHNQLRLAASLVRPRNSHPQIDFRLCNDKDMHTHTHIYLFIYLCICICVCMCVYVGPCFFFETKHFYFTGEVILGHQDWTIALAYLKVGFLNSPYFWGRIYKINKKLCFYQKEPKEQGFEYLLGILADF